MLALCVPSPAHAAGGAALFQQHCAACHQLDGSGVPSVFPPLAGNPVAQDAARVRSIITNGLSGPLQVGGLPYQGAMPAFGDRLSAADIQALTAYVGDAWGNATSTSGSQAGPAAGRATGQPTQPASPPGAGPGTSPGPGSAGAGRALFSGRVRLHNGGTPCAACHSIDGSNPLGGGSMGRDLTTAYDRLGQSTGLQGVLHTIGFPVMRQAFATHPLTQPEIDDLVAYLRDTAATAQARGTAGREPTRFGFNWLWLFGAVGAALLFALLLTWWPRQRESVAQHLRRTGRLGRDRR